MILRPATLRDWAMLYDWRNDPQTVTRSRTKRSVAINDHLVWLVERLANEGGLYIACDGCACVGTGRLDWAGHSSAELSLTVAPKHRGQGYAKRIIRELLVLARRQGAATFLAEVEDSNEASLKAFAACGFVPESTRGSWVQLICQD